jgi:hypothetical protein
VSAVDDFLDGVTLNDANRSPAAPVVVYCVPSRRYPAVEVAPDGDDICGQYMPWAYGSDIR